MSKVVSLVCRVCHVTLYGMAMELDESSSADRAHLTRHLTVSDERRDGARLETLVPGAKFAHLQCAK